MSGGYEIKIRNSGLALQVMGGTSAVNGAGIEQWPYEAESFQTWVVTPTSDGYFTVSPVSNKGACMDVRAISRSNDAMVQQWSCNGQDNQKWRLVLVPNQ